MNIKKTIKCYWISNISWESLTMKEKDFIIFTHERKYTKKMIMRKLYISNNSSYWRIQKSVKEKLKKDLEEFNKSIKINVAKCNKTKRISLK